MVIEMGEDSPLGVSQSSASSGLSDNTDEKIPNEKTKAGMSNELNSMVVTPPKDLSPNSMDLRLAFHCADIASAAMGNPLVKELKDELVQAVDLTNNPFAKCDKGVKATGRDENVPGINDKSGVGLMNNLAHKDDGQPAAVDGSNTETPGGASRSVGMNGMNKEEKLGSTSDGLTINVDGMNTETPGVSSRPAGMNGMNKELNGGEGLLVGGKVRERRIPGRRIEGQSPKASPTSRLVFGAKAPKNIMAARACPGIESPKRQTPMEIDTPTPPKRKRKGRKSIIPPGQKLITQAWDLERSGKDKDGNDE